MTVASEAPAAPRRIAIMQPYLFPYLGYFQLVSAADEFWLLDTVSFIQSGWMNRNSLCLNGVRTLFTLPVEAGPHEAPLTGRAYSPKALRALDKLVKSVRFGYARAPHVSALCDLLEAVRMPLAAAEAPVPFVDLTERALRLTLERIGVATPVRRISELGLDPDLKAQARLIAACRARRAGGYLNMIGGRDLYEASDFAEAGIELEFLEAVLPPYRQPGGGFEPGLSILDLIANCAPEEIRAMLPAARIHSGQSLPERKL
ncbi:MAG: WbqC family protein [Defluviimonas sp.]|uniref:WbqC family protein n=1 Tax=Albidovulum sp. TaxID=1872424 RepID=UPI001D67FE35|nr:WbqC family protein [Paracoccaceae bacterium]MCC0063317.1 WbqC family protein [Defluviimonas sp.]